MHLIKSQKSTNTSKFQQDFSRKGPSWLFVPVVLFRLPSVDCVWWWGRRGFYTASIDQNFPPSSQQQVNCFVHTDSVWPDHRVTKRGRHTVTQYRDDLLKGQYSCCEDLIYICFLTRAKNLARVSFVCYSRVCFADLLYEFSEPSNLQIARKRTGKFPRTKLYITTAFWQFVIICYYCFLWCWLCCLVLFKKSSKSDR